MREFEKILENHGRQLSIIRPDGTQTDTYGFIQPVINTSSAGNSRYSEVTPLGEKDMCRYRCFLPADAQISDIYRTQIICAEDKFNILRAEEIYIMGKVSHVEAVLIRRAADDD